jgi:Uma2 family endonuclease
MEDLRSLQRSVEEYLESEASSIVRHEFLNGTLHEMAGASRNHNRLVRRIERLLNDQFGNGPCEAWNSDIKLRIRTSLSEFFYYPDVMVGCDPADNDHYYLESPSILFEVLSPLTEQIDRREKLLAYQAIPSLEHYVIVSQTERQAEWLRREGNSWTVSVLSDPADGLEFSRQNAALTIGEVYEGITFE